MKKNILPLFYFAIGLLFLCSCSSDSKQEIEAKNQEILIYNEYIQSLNPIIESINEIAAKINSIDYEEETALADLQSQLSLLENQYKKLSEVKEPDGYSALDDFANEAYEYIKEANGYIKNITVENQDIAQTGNEGNKEKYIESAIECYKRADKRLRYILQVLYR